MDIFNEVVPLWTSIFFFIISIIQIFVSKEDSKWIYISLSIGWIGGVVFYIMVSFFDLAGHDWSAPLRSFQNIFCFLNHNHWGIKSKTVAKHKLSSFSILSKRFLIFSPSPHPKRALVFAFLLMLFGFAQ